MVLNRRFALTVVVTAVLMSVLMLGAEQLIAILPEGSPWRVAIAVLPLLPVLLIGLRMEWKMFLAFDELQQRVHLMALMFGSTVLVTYCAVGIMLEVLAGHDGLPLAFKLAAAFGEPIEALFTPAAD